MTTAMKGVLAGLRVVDFSTLLPGPLATLFLAEAGAEVIKIEPPGRGEEMRSYVPRWGDDSANFHLLNRGKKSVCLDLKSADGKAKIRPLIESADIVMEQFRPGVMARLGLSYDDVRAIKKDIIYCSITGYGQTGPYQTRTGHDLNYQGDTGLLALSVGPADAPVIPPALIADIAGGMYPALVNILMALRHRDQTGESSHLDIAMAENLFPFVYWALADGQATGKWPGNADSLVTGGGPRYRLYPTSDGKVAAIAAIEQKFWETLCETIGLDPALRDDARDPQATIAGIGRIIAARPAAHWQPIFEKANCCCSIVAGLHDAMSDPQFVARKVFSARTANASGQEIKALPVSICRQFRHDPDGVRQAPPLGRDTHAYTEMAERKKT